MGWIALEDLHQIARFKFLGGEYIALGESTDCFNSLEGGVFDKVESNI